ncbi:hypothetical protein [Azorhizobium sp. AG788]|uniref:hypothetical protein n=1 Tax=Azorhizobium sp. AG788 TaxID=2183897 RepID=UPI00105DC1E7|nr:hypothetical protein [Azorhizobium sp. AG788]
MEFDFMLAKDLLTAAGIATGIGLGLWSRWDIMAEARRRKEKEAPRVEAQMGREENGWRMVLITITPRDDEPFEVTHVKIGNGLRIAPSTYRKEQRERLRRGSSFWETEGYVDVRTVSVPVPDPEASASSVEIGSAVRGKSPRLVLWISGEALSKNPSMEPRISIKCRSMSNSRRYFLVRAAIRMPRVAD